MAAGESEGKNSGQRKWRAEELVPPRKSQSPPVLSVCHDSGRAVPGKSESQDNQGHQPEG